MRTLFINGKVWLSKYNFADEFGIDDDKFNYTGKDRQANKKEYDEVIDLQGRLVLPGLIDGHMHLVYGSLMKTRLDCSNAESFTHLKKIIKDYIEANNNREFIIGGNLNSSVINVEDSFLEALDNTRPIFITNYDYHSGYCNLKAMEKTGLLGKINEFSEDIIPGKINGNYKGIVKEAAMNYMFANLPPESSEEKANAVRLFEKVMHSYGLTGASDIILRENIAVYKILFENELKLRIGAYLPIEFIAKLDELRNVVKDIDSSKFDIKGLKAFYDGALGSSTALFKDNYKGEHYNGYRTEMAESGKLKELALNADKKRIQVIVHAIGDKAVKEVLDIAEEMVTINGKYDRRFRIEHSQHIDEADFEKFRDLNIIASVQPVHLKYDAGLVIKMLDEKTIKRTHNYKHLLDLGVKLNFGTDFPIAGINPFENIQTALLRKFKDGTFYPENRIPLHECIEAYTINNAFANFTDKMTGSITRGKKADFIIMDDDIFNMDPEIMDKAQVYRTYFNGGVVYPLSTCI